MKMKNCELCKGLARMHCESDRASLCWSCDYKVHSANFLVARHSRTLLCQVCQSPTPWTAAGLKLGPTASVCDSCVQNYNKINADVESEATNENEMESDNFDDDDEEEDDEDEDEEYDYEEDTDCEDNQVVPWSPSTPPPPSTANSPSNGEEESYSSSSISSSINQREAQRKRTRENTYSCYNMNCVSTYSQENADTPPAGAAGSQAAAALNGSETDRGRLNSVDSLSTISDNSLKKQKIKTGQSNISLSRSLAIIESIQKLHQREMRSSEAIAELRRLNEDRSAINCDSSDSI